MSSSTAKSTANSTLKPAAELVRASNMRFPNESAEYSRAREALLVEEIELRRQIERVVYSFMFGQRCSRGKGGAIRHFWGGEIIGASADPGQDPRGAPDLMPIWTILDTTPEGRGTDWYPKLTY